MALERFSPKYKSLVKLRRILWLEKKNKLKSFGRRKWEVLKKLYAPKKLRNLKTYEQDSALYKLGNDYETRLKKIYLFLLRDKQAFQLYYGSRRLKLFKLKTVALWARKCGLQRDLSSSRVFYHMMESRFDVLLYRLYFVDSLMKSRKLFSSDSVEVFGSKGFGFFLSFGSIVKVESVRLLILMLRYLRLNTLWFYYGKRLSRRRYMLGKIVMLLQPFLAIQERNLLFFSFFRVFSFKKGWDLKLISSNKVSQEKEFNKNIDAVYSKNLFKSLYQSDVFFDVCLYQSTNLKVHYYGFLKLLQLARFSKLLGSVFWFFQFNGVFESFSECVKKARLPFVGLKLDFSDYYDVFYKDILLLKRKIPGSWSRRGALYSFSKALVKYEDFYVYPGNLSRKRLLLLTLKREVIGKFLFFRFFPYLSASKKQSRLPFHYFSKKRRRLTLVFLFYPRVDLRFKNMLKRRNVKFRKLVWKRNKRKKWQQKRWGLLGKLLFYRSRNRSPKFLYFPRNVEVNLKTFLIFYLGYTDFSTVNSRIYFWFNLRRLLTFFIK